MATNFEDVKIAPLSMTKKYSLYYCESEREIEIGSTAEYINDMYFSHIMHSTILRVIKIIRSRL